MLAFWDRISICLALLFCGMPIMAAVDLEVVSVATPDPVVLGETVTYSITITNHGEDIANNIVVVDQLPLGAQFLSADQGGTYDSENHRVTWSLSSLDPSQTQDISMSITANLPDVGASVTIHLNGTEFDNGNPAIFEVAEPSFQVIYSNISETVADGILSQGDGSFFVTQANNPNTVEGGLGVLDGNILKVSSNGNSNLANGQLLVNPRAAVMGIDGFLYVADPFGVRDNGAGGVSDDLTGRIIKIDSITGDQVLFAEGNHLVEPRDITMDMQANFIIADGSGKLIGIDKTTGAQTLLSDHALLADLRSVTMALDGNIYAASGVEGILSINPDTFAVTVLTVLNPENGIISPFDIQAGFNQELFVSDQGFESIGAIHDIDLRDGSIYKTWLGAAVTGFSNSRGLEVSYFYENTVSVSADEIEIETNNNTHIYRAGISPPMNNTVTINVTESIGVTDQATLNPALMIHVTETVGVSESNAANPSGQITAIETVTLADQVTVTPALQINVTEQISTSDLASSVPAVQIQVSETIQTLENQQTSSQSGFPIIEKMFLYNDPTIFEEGLTRASLTQIQIVFSELMANPKGDSETNDVTNPVHYLLVANSESPQTTSCNDLSSADQHIPIRSVTFNDARRSAALNIDSETALPRGHYRIFVCGHTGLTDLEGLSLDGDQDGKPGGEFTVDFQVAITNKLVNPNFDEDLNGWNHSTGITRGDDDSDQSPSSGVALMLDEGQGTSMNQCVAVTPRTWYRLSGKVRFRRDGPTVPLTARVDYYPSEDCQGELMGSKTVPLDLGTDGQEWVQFEVTMPIPTDVISAHFTIAYPAGITGSAQIEWDNLTLAEDPDLIFADGFESGDLSRWQ